MEAAQATEQKAVKSKNVSVSEFFENALSILKTRTAAELEAILGEILNFILSPSFIFDNATESSILKEASDARKCLQDMLQLIILAKRRSFDAILTDADQKRMKELIETLGEHRSAFNRNGPFYHLYVYISHTALVCKSLINHNHVLNLKNIKQLLLNVYHWEQQTKKVTFETSSSYIKEYLQQLESGLRQLTENDGSDHVFSRYVRELLSLTLEKMFQMQESFLDQSNNCFAALSAGVTRVSTFSKAGDIAFLNIITRERRRLAYIKELAGRLQLDAYPAFKGQIVAKPAIDVETAIKHFHERTLYLTKVLKTFLFLDEANYKNNVEFNDTARSLSLTLECEISLFIADLKKSGQPNSKAALHHLKWLLQVVKTYCFSLDKTFPLDEVNIINELPIYELHFNEYFKSYSIPLSMLMHQRADFLLQTINNPSLRLDIFKKFRNELDFLFSAYKDCPENVKSAASVFIMEYFFVCFKLATENEEYFELLPLLSKVKKELNLEPHVVGIFEILCKYYRYVPNVSDAQYTEIFKMLDDYYSTHKFNFNKLNVSGYFYANYMAMVNDLISKFRPQGTRPDIAIRLNKLITKLQAAVSFHQEFENEFISKELRLDNEFDIFKVEEAPKVEAPVKVKAQPKPKPKKKAKVKKVVVDMPAYVQASAETMDLPEIQEWPCEEDTPCFAQNSSLLFAMKVDNIRSMYDIVPRRREIKPLVQIPPKQPVDLSNPLANYYLDSPLLLGRTIMLSEVDNRLIHYFTTMGFPTYIYGDRVCSSIYDIQCDYVSMLCFGPVEAILQCLEANQRYFGFKSVTHNPVTNALSIDFPDSSYHILINCRGGLPLVSTMTQLCYQEIFNSTIFFDMQTGYFFDITGGEYFNKVIAYSRNYLHQDFNFKPILDITLLNRLAPDSVARLIISSFFKLGHYEECSMGVGHNLERLITNNKKFLTSQVYPIKAFDALFIQCSPLKMYKWLHKEFNALRCLFPMLDLDCIKSFKKACLKHSEKEYRRYYNSYNEAELTSIRAEMLVDMFYDSFRIKYPNTENFKENIINFYQTLPFNIKEDEHLLESIYMISRNRVQSEVEAEPARVRLK